MLSVCVLDKIYKRGEFFKLKSGGRMQDLTQLYIILAKLINPEESSIKNLSRSLESVEGDIELIVRGEDNKVAHLATVGACDGSKRLFCNVKRNIFYQFSRPDCRVHHRL